MRILVSGASGYVGGRLVPALLDAGHDVVATFRDTSSSDRFWWAGHPRLDVTTMDVLEAATVRRALDQCDAAYYLIHGMDGDDFVERDRLSAKIFGQAAADASLERIVYLSGLVPQVPEDQLSPHISSRLEVERVLGDYGVPTISLRAAILIGSGSTSFEIVRQISERLPIQTIPTWMRSDVQPIAVTDAVAALVGALDAPAVTRAYDIGGPEQMAYSALLDIFADVAGLQRPQISVPLLPSKLVGLMAGNLTDVPGPVVEALVESLRHDMVCHEDDFRTDLLPPGHEMVTVKDAIRRGLARQVPGTPEDELDPMGPLPTDPDWAGGWTSLAP